ADQFWNATPAEMEAVVSAMLERKAAGEGPPSRPDIAKLQEMFPDG
ncbi:phage tail assembly chaperone, partial [Neptunomonas marina]